MGLLLLCFPEMEPNQQVVERFSANLAANNQLGANE